MAVTTHRELDVSVVRGFLRELRRGTIFIAKVTKSGRNGRYSYLIPPLELLKTIGVGAGTRFDVRVNLEEGYIDYIVDESGTYKLTVARGAAQIRFPIDSVRGYVVVEPRPRGFRVYFA